MSRAPGCARNPYRGNLCRSPSLQDSPGRDDYSNRSPNREWAEITNNTRRSVNLDGWTLTDEDGRTCTFDHYRLDGRPTVRVHTGHGRDSRHDLYQDRRHYVWDNRSDTATLRNHRDRSVDDHSWGPPPLTPAGRAGDPGPRTGTQRIVPGRGRPAPPSVGQPR
ncbi:lamin tail domain-containing protein [Streptomyces sp. NPDC052309]|uniref:lamin tail domain-containing protein n=1 Tax=Streptomyces sp. NPDC052309 TaxID=3155421 RepID=UPI0034129907